MINIVKRRILDHGAEISDGLLFAIDGGGTADPVAGSLYDPIDRSDSFVLVDLDAPGREVDPLQYAALLANVGSGYAPLVQGEAVVADVPDRDAQETPDLGLDPH